MGIGSSAYEFDGDPIGKASYARGPGGPGAREAGGGYSQPLRLKAR